MKEAVGKAAEGGTHVAVRYRPYMIDPNTMKKGEDYAAYNQRRWGGDGWTDPLRARGKDVGITFESWSTWPNTFNAHRLCLFLEQKDKRSKPPFTDEEMLKRAVELVNKYYELTYERGANISTPEGAALALEELGFATKKEAIQWLQLGGGESEVMQADSYAKRDLDVRGVPFFVISREDATDEPVSLRGAQHYSAFLDAFQQLSK